MKRIVSILGGRSRGAWGGGAWAGILAGGLLLLACGGADGPPAPAGGATEGEPGAAATEGAVAPQGAVAPEPAGDGRAADGGADPAPEGTAEGTAPPPSGAGDPDRVAEGDGDDAGSPWWSWPWGGGDDGGGDDGGGGAGDPAADGAVAATTACGPVRPWDRDGDGISDSVEANHVAEGYLPLDPDRCDDDPTLPRGTWYQGALQGSLNLTDRGTGYVHNRGSDPVDGDDWGSLALVHCLEEVGRQWEGSGLVMGVNDLSQRPGREFPPHRSHQNGLDADLRYVRTDGVNAPLDLRRNPELYDAVATQELLRLFVHHCDVNVLFVDLENLGFGNAEMEAGRDVLRHAPGHSNHFHVRLSPPGGTS